MPEQRLSLHRLPATHRLVLVFVASILVPGVVLGVFGLRALIQEKRLADQQQREAVEAAAEAALQRLVEQFAAWNRALDQLASTARASSGWPERVRAATAEPGSAVVLVGQPGQVEALPPGQLPYPLSPAGSEPRARPPATPLWTEAESSELRSHDPAKALTLYRQVLGTAKPDERALVLHRVARCLLRAGRTREALEAFRQLEREPVTTIGTLPSDLIALYETARLGGAPEPALRLYRGLVGGRWRLEKASHAFYLDRARQWVPTTEAVLRLEQQARRKLALGRAVELFLESPRPLLITEGAVCLAFWRQEPFAAVLLGEDFLRSELWPSVFHGSAFREIEFSVIAPGGQILFGGSPPDRRPVAARSLTHAELALRLEAWHRNPEALFESVARRRNLYFGMLSLVTALLVFGGYLTWRTVRTELAMAQLKSDFVSTVSHEFRSPLAGIHQLGEMLRDGRVKDERRRQEYYEMIVSESRRLRRLVENLLDFSRMEEGRKQYHSELLETAPWLRRVVEDFQAEVAQTGYTVAASIPDEMPAIQGDRDALATAVHNLLDNAVKYSPDSRTVRLEAAANGQVLSIAVRDHGAGIREEDRRHIFEKFYRGGELAQQVKGAGLGLALVKHIVTAHGGTVDFQSKHGEGSTFAVHLKAGG